MAVPGLYRRTLPSPPAIEFASPDGKKLFSEALIDGNMEGFFKLISYYHTQSEPAYCGLATLATVLNALSIDPGRTWKGPWRWFDDSMLDCCEPLSVIKVKGITFGKVACLAHCNGAKVETFRTNETTVDDFRKHVVSCTDVEDCHVIVSYNRKVFLQTGSGHFSPIGGYHAGSDMVLILDVARFKYPPHWVPLTLLWEAMDTIDEATGNRRGFMILSSHQKPPSILYTLSCRNEGWKSIAKYLTEDVPLLLRLGELKEVEDVLSIVFKSPPADLRDFIRWVAEVRRQENGSLTISKEEKGRITIKEEILKQVRETELFKYMMRWLASEISLCKDKSSSYSDSLPEIAANICCQGEELLTAKCISSEMCCKKPEVKFLRDNGNKPVTLVSGSIISGGNEQRVDIIVPSSHTEASGLCEFDHNGCRDMHPYTADVLTVLLLSLPQNIWSGVGDEKLQTQISHLVSTENLPSLLQEEVLHLQRQLHFLVTESGFASSP